jgi:hypothetical protein
MEHSKLPSTPSPFFLYTAADGNVKVEVFVQDETVWLTQKAMADLFGVKIPAISKHLANIFETGELNKEATLSILETVQTEGMRQVSRNVEFYNLDAIIAVGYRVNSYQATQYRPLSKLPLKFSKSNELTDNGKIKRIKRL